jgi:hypothetical protein
MSRRFPQTSKVDAGVNFFRVPKSDDWSAIWSASRSAADPLIAQKTGVDNFSRQSKLRAIDG